MTDPASQCLLQRNGELILPKELIEQFERDGIITKDTADEIKTYNLLALCTTVARDHSKLKAIGEALCQCDHYKSYGNQLLQEYSECT